MSDDVAEPELAKDWLNWFLPPASAPGFPKLSVEPVGLGGPPEDMDMMETRVGKVSKVDLEFGLAVFWAKV